MLRAEKDAGGAVAEISKSEESHYKRIREFIRCAPKYDGNPKKVLSVEHHLLKHKWETIPNKRVKWMLWSCITGLTRNGSSILKD